MTPSAPFFQRPVLRTGAAAALLSLGLLAAGGAQAAKVVTVVDMGELAPGLGSEANAINNNNRSVGRAMEGVNFEYRQVVWDGLKLKEFSACCAGFLPTMQSINLSGEVVAFYKATRTHWIPVYWTPQGTSAELPALGPYGFGKAYAINDAGQIAGSSVDANFDIHAVIWDANHQIQDLGFMGEPAPEFKRFSQARSINASGVVVGEGLVGYDNRAFQWVNGVYTDLGLGAATHINNNGLVAGYTAGRIPVTWTAGVMKYLPGLDGRKKAYGHQVNGINSQGDLVGYAPSPDPGVFTVAVLWRRGKLVKLGHFPGGNNSYATGINDQGVIVGSGNLVPSGPHHALRWKLVNQKVTVERE